MSMRAKCDRQKMWCAIRAFQLFSIPEIAEICEVTVDSARKYVWMLRRHGYITWQEGDRDNTKFCLVRDTGGMAPAEQRHGLKDPNMAGQVTDASQRLWNVISMLKDWDCYSLAAAAQVPYTTAFRYSKGLTAHEYAKCEARDRRSRDSRDQFRLLLKTGAIAPLFLEDGSIFDANLFLEELWALKNKKSRRKA